MTNSPEDRDSTQKSIVQSEWYGFLVGGLPFVAGAMTTFLKEDITKAWPVGKWPGLNPDNWRINFPAAIYWGCMAAWPLLYILRERAQGQVSRRLHAVVTNMEAALATMPLGAFIRNLARSICESADRVSSRAPRSKTTDDNGLQNTLRTLLDDIATLAATYDGRPSVRYAANVMFFVKLDELSALDNVLVFGITNENATDWKGALVLLKKFSSAEYGHGSPDEYIENLALPVPNQAKDPQTGRWRALPGAPRVYLGAAPLLL
jgi:hypothetical protein